MKTSLYWTRVYMTSFNCMFGFAFFVIIRNILQYNARPSYESHVMIKISYLIEQQPINNVWMGMNANECPVVVEVAWIGSHTCQYNVATVVISYTIVVGVWIMASVKCFEWHNPGHYYYYSCFIPHLDNIWPRNPDNSQDVFLAYETTVRWRDFLCAFVCYCFVLIQSLVWDEQINRIFLCGRVKRAAQTDQHCWSWTDM